MGVMTTYVIIISVGIFLMGLERWVPDQKLPDVKKWWQRVIVINFIQLGVVVMAGLTWERHLQGWSIFHITDHLSTVGSAIICYLAIIVVFYWWHRWRHTVNFFWLALHQVHHSPQRIETITSFYKHPLEIAMNSLIISVLSYTVLGVTMEIASIVTVMTALAEFFYHMNIKTPHWIGYFIKRPEMHRIHHQRGKHFNNFADLPVLDMLFGTYENPKTYQGACGYLPDREGRLKDMFLFRNVNNEIKKN